MKREAYALFHPRPNGGAPRWVRFRTKLVQLRASTPVLLYRWRSARKPGPFCCDASVPLPGEEIALLSAPDERGQVLQ